MLLEKTSGTILKAFFAVYNTLGYGFLEKVYENSLLLELSKHGLTVIQQYPIKVYYQGTKVGDYIADIIVNNQIVLELKSVEYLKEEHYKQLQNYLKATDKELGLLLNFGKKAEFRRIILTNDRK